MLRLDCMARQWLGSFSGSLPDTSIKKNLPHQIEKLRAIANREAQHARTPEIVANLMIGIQYFLRFAIDAGTLTKVGANEVYKNAWQVLLESAALQARGRSADQPARRFLDLIAAAHLRGELFQRLLCAV
jgi:hypothetical protein